MGKVADDEAWRRGGAVLEPRREHFEVDLVRSADGADRSPSAGELGDLGGRDRRGDQPGDRALSYARGARER